MTDAVKLLTEAEWNHIWAQANNKTPAQMREYLRERGLIAPEPDPVTLETVIADKFRSWHWSFQDHEVNELARAVRAFTKEQS